MSADEFDIIATHFAPLVKSEAARGLVDDAAVLQAQGKLVVTTDAIVEGVHFLADDPIETVAKKALRVNVSDLVAKGAKPVAALLTLIWPQHRPAGQIAEFARGLGEDLAFYDIDLLGGDTTATPGPLCISITALGVPLGARIPARADAQPGDQLWLTGRIGDALLGLMLLTRAPEIIGAAAQDQIDAQAAYLRARYRVPEPPIAFAGAIAEFARASMDVSDGLIGDAAKIAAASGAALRIDGEAIPLSAAGHAFVQKHGQDGLVQLASGGDDYQILFTAPPEARGAIIASGKRLGVEVGLIGDVAAGGGVQLIGASGALISIGAGGHRHRLG